MCYTIIDCVFGPLFLIILMLQFVKVEVILWMDYSMDFWSQQQYQYLRE